MQGNGRCLEKRSIAVSVQRDELSDRTTRRGTVFADRPAKREYRTRSDIPRQPSARLTSSLLHSGAVISAASNPAARAASKKFCTAVDTYAERLSALVDAKPR